MSNLQQNLGSPFGRLDVRAKLAIGFCLSVIAVLIDSLPLLAGVSLAGLVIFLATRPTRGQARLVAVSCLLLAWGMVFSQAIFYSRFPRQELLRLLPASWLLPDGLAIYREGIRHGLVQSLRMIGLGLTGYAICFSTDPDKFLRGLLALKVPFGLAFMAVSAIRFLPVFAGEFQTVRTAMRLKGYRPLRRGLRQTIRTEVASLRPILLGAIRRSEEVALSIQVRGFQLDTPRTSLHDDRLGWPTRLGIGTLVLVTGVLATLKVLFWLYQYQLFYVPILRPIYAFVRLWL